MACSRVHSAFSLLYIHTLIERVFANLFKTAITTCNKNKRLCKVKCSVEVREEM